MKTRTLFLAPVLLFAPSELFAQAIPLDQTEILGRLAAAYSPSYVGHLVKTRGVSFSPAPDFIFRVKLAGGDGVLVERLSSASPSASTVSASADQPVKHLAKCAELIHTGDLDSAEKECRASIEESPKSPWPLLLTAQLLQRSFSYTSATQDKELIAERAALVSRAVTLAPHLAMAHQAFATTAPPQVAMVELQAAGTADPENLENSEIIGWGTAPNMFASAWRKDAGEPSASSNEPITIDPELLRHIQIDPDLAGNHVGLAYQYFQVRNFGNARNELAEAVRLEPDNSQLHLYLALFHFSRNDTDAAFAEFREAVRIVPYGTLQHMALAGAFELRGHTSEAITEIQNLIALRPADPQPSDFLVELYLEHKDRKSAIGELRRCLKASSLASADQAKFVDARYASLDHLANLLKEDRQLEAAAEQYLFLLRFKPDSAGLHNDYGNVLLDLRRMDDAIAEYNEAIRLDPTMSTPHHNIGLCLAMKKNLDRAIAEFRRTLELNPDEPRTQIFLGTALGQNGDLTAAMEQFRQVLEKNPEDADAHLSLAYALMQLKDTPGAIGELKRTLELRPDSPAAENDLAWLYATADDPKLRNPTEALRLARHAVESSPQPNAAFVDTLAEALLLNGQPAEALATELQAAKLDPENPEMQSRLARFREAASHLVAAKP
jgi:tetratricopeptide (TPR) repeat protein